METLPSRFEQSLESDLPLDPDEIDRLRAFAPRLPELSAELAAYGVAETVQHDDLHFANLYEKDGRLRVLDWGDTSISHPFASLYTIPLPRERHEAPARRSVVRSSARRLPGALGQGS